jgi:hypothetical protein
MPEVVDIIKEAVEKVGDQFPFDIDERRKKVGEPFEGKRMEFGDSDSKYYELADTNRLIFRKKPKFVPFADAYAMKYLSESGKS